MGCVFLLDLFRATRGNSRRTLQGSGKQQSSSDPDVFQQAELHHAAVLLDSEGWVIFLTLFVIYCSAKHRPLAEKRHDSATLKLVSEIIFALRSDKMFQRVINI